MRHIYDLSYRLEPGMPTYPTHWHPVLEFTPLGRHGIENRETRKLVIGTHTGTHCDAPRHFLPGGDSIEQLDLDPFVGSARILDLTGLGRPQVELEDLQARLERVPERLLLRYDWCKHWGTMHFFTHHPYLSQAAANWLAEGGLRLLGMDSPSPDNPQDGWKSPQDSPVHKILMGKNVILLEYLCNLAQVPVREVSLIALPLKLAEGDGSPVRCVAIVEE